MSDFAKDANVSANDCISRQAAIDTLNFDAELLRRVLDDADVVGAEREKYEWGLGLIESNIFDMKELPSAERRGRWMKGDEMDDYPRVPYKAWETYCSCCGEIMEQSHDNFCGNCGAKMDEVEE